MHCWSPVWLRAAPPVCRTPLRHCEDPSASRWFRRYGACPPRTLRNRSGCGEHGLSEGASSARFGTPTLEASRSWAKLTMPRNSLRPRNAGVNPSYGSLLQSDSGIEQLGSSK